MIRSTVARVLLVLLVATGFTALQPTPQAQAAAGNEFNAGNIISDAAFYDGSALNATQVQGFLNQQVPTCQSGYVCLKSYQQATPTMAADYLCNAYTGSSNESAAQIIAKVGVACNISQRVLLVLLQKEQSLVTHTWPSTWRFDKATGFACPDTAPCNPAYNGFFYQVYYAARQFQRYATEPTRYNYQAGRVNHILYHPNAACGTSPVFIANKATAGLYNYTPYQPNGAALANLYGTGDSCSSYGNRNFWRMYSDWFGSPAAGSSLVRTADNSTVYLLSGNIKYPIPSLSVLNSLSPLGQVAYVSNAFLGGYTQGSLAGGLYRDENGSIFLLDSGYKISFRTCDQVADFGYSCSSAAYVQLTNMQAAAFNQGPILTNLVGTQSGMRYWVATGTKAEILDATSQAQAGITGSMTVLTDAALSKLTLAAPIARDDVVVKNRQGGTFAVFSGGNRYSIDSASGTAIGANSRSAGSLEPGSIALRGSDLGAIGRTVKDAAGTTYVLSPTGKWALTGSPAGLTAQTVPQWFLDTYASLGTIEDGSFLIGPNGGTVYVVMGDAIRPIASWGALEALSLDGNIVMTTVDQAVLDAMPKGPVALTAGTLVRNPTHATVYLINGVSSRIAFASFVFPNEAGFTKFSYASSDRLDAYPLEPTLMSFGFTCGDDKYFGAGGSLHYIAPDLEPLYPVRFVPLDKFTCGTINEGTAATRFVRTANGTIWLLAPEGRRYISSMARLQELGGSEGWITVHDWMLSPIPVLGPA